MPDAEIRRREREGDLSGYSEVWRHFAECGQDYTSEIIRPVVVDGVRMWCESRNYDVFGAISGTRRPTKNAPFATLGWPSDIDEEYIPGDWYYDGHTKWWFRPEDIPIRFFKTYPECARGLHMDGCAKRLIVMCHDLVAKFGVGGSRVFGSYDC